MGYEVLDAGGPDHLRGTARERPAVRTTPWPDTAPEVVELAILTGPVTLPLNSPPLRVRRELPRRRTAMLAALLVATGAFSGALVGAALGHRRAVQAQVAADQATLAAVAYATEVTRYVGAGGQTALLRVRLTNAGPLPVDVVATPFGAQSLPGRPVVRQYGPTSAVRAGADLDVLMTVTVDCGDRSDNVPHVPVRTTDGNVHQVPIRSRQVELDLAIACPLSDG